MPSRDEVERTRGWLHQKVLGSEGARSTSLLALLFDRTVLYLLDLLYSTYFSPRCSAPISSGCVAYCALARDVPRCAPLMSRPAASRTTKTASRWRSKDTGPNPKSNYNPHPSSNPNPTQVEVYTDLKTEVDTHKDIPTASTCARKIYLPVFTEEHHFVQKLDSALLNFKAQQNQRGGAEFSYE